MDKDRGRIIRSGSTEDADPGDAAEEAIQQDDQNPGYRRNAPRIVSVHGSILPLFGVKSNPHSSVVSKASTTSKAMPSCPSRAFRYAMSPAMSSTKRI